MPDTTINVDKEMLFVRTLLEIIKKKDSTLVEVYGDFIKVHPRSWFNKVFHPPADIDTVDAYLKSITNHEFIVQVPAPWSKKGNAQVILYQITDKGRSFLSGKKK